LCKNSIFFYESEKQQLILPIVCFNICYFSNNQVENEFIKRKEQQVQKSL